MEQHNESNLITKGPCEKCGSSDANAIYDDGHTHCFSCGAHASEGGEVKPAPKKAKGLLPIGEAKAIPKRKLTLATCRKWGITHTKLGGKPAVAFNYKDQAGNIVAQKVRTAGKEFKFLGDTKNSGLFGQHLWRTKGKRIVITEGEIDAASVSQVQGHKWPVVSVDNGASGAKKSLQKALDWLQGFEEVVLCFDDDEPGRAATAECASLFRPGQCLIARLPRKDANDMLQAGEEKALLDALWSAKAYRPDGIVMGRDMWSLVSETEETLAVPYPWQGIQAKTLGARLGELVTLTAGSGIGKSSVVRELAYSLATQGEQVGMLMFEESIKRTALGLIGVHASKNYQLMSDPASDPDFKPAFDATMPKFVLYDHFGSTSFDNVIDRVRYMAKALDTRWVFLDHLSILVSGMEEGDERRLIDNAMTSLKTTAMECNIGLFLVSHLKRPPVGRGHENGARTELGQLRGSHAIGQLSDIVIGLERDQQDKKLRNVTTLRVLKNRFTGETGLAGWLHYDKVTGRLKELLDDPTSCPPTDDVSDASYF